MLSHKTHFNSKCLLHLQIISVQYDITTYIPMISDTVCDRLTSLVVRCLCSAFHSACHYNPSLGDLHYVFNRSKISRPYIGCMVGALYVSRLFLKKNATHCKWSVICSTWDAMDNLNMTLFNLQMDQKTHHLAHVTVYRSRAQVPLVTFWGSKV